MLIKDSWGRNVRVCVPCLNEETHTYAWSWLEPGQETRMGHWHVPELPHVNWLGDVQPDLVIVPVIAPAFDFQLVDQIPVTEKDINVDLIVTERDIYDLR